jgi:hypothetical protein
MDDFAVLSFSRHILTRNNKYLGIKSLGALRVSNNYVLSRQVARFGGTPPTRALEAADFPPKNQHDR